MKGENPDMLVCDKCRIVGKPAKYHKVGLFDLTPLSPELSRVRGGVRPLISFKDGEVDLCASCATELAGQILQLIAFKEPRHEDRDTEVDRIVPSPEALARETSGPSTEPDRQPTADGPPPLRSRVRKNDGV